jgi:hypothetical protein
VSQHDLKDTYFSLMLIISTIAPTAPKHSRSPQKTTTDIPKDIRNTLTDIPKVIKNIDHNLLVIFTNHCNLLATKKFLQKKAGLGLRWRQKQFSAQVVGGNMG